MKVHFLGTGTSQGIPVIACRCEVCRSSDPRDKRLRSSVLIEETDRVIVIDTGPDFRQQMLRHGSRRLDAILFTHDHRDHIAGLDDIRSYNWLQKKPMDLYAEERVARALNTQFPYIFAERKYPGVPRVNVHIIDSTDFMVNGIKIMPIRTLHYRLPVLGFRVGSFAYITDTNHIPAEEMHKLQGLDYLAICALRKKQHVSHFNLEEALRVIEQCRPGQAYLTHIGHQLGRHQEVDKELPSHVRLAYDGLQVSLSS